MPKKIGNSTISEIGASSDEVYQWLIRSHDSYTRLDALLTLRSKLHWRVFFKSLGLIWSTSDNICKYKGDLEDILNKATRYQLDLMMDEDEIKALQALPASITVYRGCYLINRDGLSWSLDKKVAERFTQQHRYSQPIGKRLLLEGLVRREDSVLKLERNEYEIISTQVKSVQETILSI
jgi:hypothetical protein